MASLATSSSTNAATSSHQALSNATSVRATLLQQNPPPTDLQVGDLVRSLKRSSEGYAFLSSRQGPLSSDAAFQGRPIRGSHGLRRRGRQRDQRFSVDGEPYMSVGISIPAAKAQYYEAIPLRDTDRHCARSERRWASVRR